MLNILEIIIDRDYNVLIFMLNIFRNYYFYIKKL